MSSSPTRTPAGAPRGNVRPRSWTAPAESDIVRAWITIALLIAIGGLVYANSLPGVLFWDDEVTVLGNAFIRHPRFLADIFLTSYHSGGGETLNFYRPLATLSFMVNYLQGGLDPFGFHFTSVLLHLLNGVLVFTLLLTIIRENYVCALAALLFIIHPVNSEVVNYVSARPESLMLANFLCGLYAYVRYRQGGRVIWLVASWLAYAGAILSKEMGLVLPLFLLAYDAMTGRRRPSLLPISGFAGIFFVYVALRSTVLNFLNLDLIRQGAQANPFSESLLIRLLTFAKACGTYLRLLVWPVNLHMEYDNPVVTSALDPTAWLAVAVLGTAVALFWFFGRWNPRLMFGLMWCMLGLLPVSGIIPINNVLGEHYLYLASPGVFLIVSTLVLEGGADERVAEWRPILGVLGVAILVTCCALTINRNRAWRDPLGMYLDIARTTKTSFLANNNAGTEYFRRGDIQQAEHYFRKALEINPGSAVGINNLGVISDRKGDVVAALRLYEQAVGLDPNYALARKNLANSYLAIGNTAQVRVHLEAVLRQYPHDQEAAELLSTLHDR